MDQALQSTTENRTNLPAIHLPPQSRNVLMRELAGTVFSLEKAREVASMPPSALPKLIENERSKLGTTISREQCDECLSDLALLLPRANMAPEDVDRMLDLYYGLLVERGVTVAMLRSACKEIAMAPAKGKPKFYPDPGELYERCRDEALTRQKALRALESASQVLALPPPPEEAYGPLRPPAEILAAHGIDAEPPRRPTAEVVAEIRASRPESISDALRQSLERLKPKPTPQDARAMQETLAERMGT